MAAYLVLAPLTLLRNDDWRGKLELYEADYRADPGNGQNASYIVHVYLERQRLGDATALCDAFFAAHPANDPMAEVCATAYERAGRADDGVGALRRAAEASRSPHTLTLLARLDLAHGDRASAEAEYTLAVARSATPVAQHIRRGESILALHPERAAEAWAEFAAALALDPGSATARDWLRQADAVARQAAAPAGPPPGSP